MQAVGRGVAQLLSVTPEVESIVAADAAAQREIESVQARLDERRRGERDRLEQTRAAETAAALARLDAEAQTIEQDAHARNERRRGGRARTREVRRAQAAAAIDAAVAAYVAIVGGPEAKS